MISFSKILTLNQMIENNGDITNREALLDHIHDNYIRNSGIGYGDYLLLRQWLCQYIVCLELILGFSNK